jgi:hypothetical protein
MAAVLQLCDKLVAARFVFVAYRQDPGSQGAEAARPAPGAPGLLDSEVV